MPRVVKQLLCEGFPFDVVLKGLLDLIRHRVEAQLVQLPNPRSLQRTYHAGSGVLRIHELGHGQTTN